jgi:hypothetical protein
MDALLTDMGFTNFHHYKSGNNGNNSLTAATIEILRQNMEEPVLVLEDDVETTGLCEFIMPADVDAIYFGLSNRAGSRTHNWDEGFVSIEPYSVSQARIKNMLSAHAILYISKAHKQRVISLLEAHMHVKYYNDVLLSRLQPEFLILANRVPTFWQSNRFNAPRDMETDTKIMFSYPSNTYCRF